MIRYILPDSFMTRNLNMLILNLMKTHRYLFNEDFELDAVYGIIKSCIWQGGRMTYDTRYIDLSEVEKDLEYYNSNGLQYRFVFSNRFLEEEHLHDYWGNAQLKLSEKYDIGIIAASETLIDYVHKNYPKVAIISSVTRGVLNDQQRLDLFKDDRYKLTVINTTINKQLEKRIPEEYRKKSEILINDCCPAFCPNHQMCYDNNSWAALGLDRKFDGKCHNPKRPKDLAPYDEYLWMKDNCENLTLEEVRELEKAGFEYFKINGRSSNILLNILYYADYMIKPEYRELFISNTIAGYVFPPANEN